MKLGVVGLPNVGKSTLFNAITQARAAAANYLFSTIEPDTGIAQVPDTRLDVLSAMYKPKKTTPATVEFVDIAGLVKGSSWGEGLGNKFLAHIREVDALVHVVRCFEDENILHVDGDVDPGRDIETVHIELIAADRETVGRRMEKALKLVKTGERSHAEEAETAKVLAEHLDNLKPARTCSLTPEQAAIVNGWFLLTTKPVLYAANIGETDLGIDEASLPWLAQVREIAAAEGARFAGDSVCSKRTR